MATGHIAPVVAVVGRKWISGRWTAQDVNFSHPSSPQRHNPYGTNKVGWGQARSRGKFSRSGGSRGQQPGASPSGGSRARTLMRD